MIAFPPTFDFDKDQVSFRVNPNAPPNTEINVIDMRIHHRWRYVLYLFAAVFLILMIAGILIVIRKKKEKPRHVYHKQRTSLRRENINTETDNLEYTEQQTDDSSDDSKILDGSTSQAFGKVNKTSDNNFSFV